MAAPVVQGQEFHFCDVTDVHQVQDVVANVLAEHGGVDILVNNAGLLEQARSLRDVTSEQLHQYFDTNAVGPMLMVQAAMMRSSRVRGEVELLISPRGPFSPAAPGSQPMWRRKAHYWA